ncbi:sulfotransferase family 2 domain-containing protein [Flavobacteriales bacterium]|nr:sulfotransferase family 2 domain-containing protein [Flavobacteriales bacterium]
MILSHKHKFIFLRTKKTAGSSLEIHLSQYCGDNDVITIDDSEAEIMKKERGVFSRNYQLPILEYRLSDWKILLRTLSKKNIRHKYSNHMSASDLKKVLPKKIWDSYFIFCFERNPYEKAVSAYLYHIRTHDLDIRNYSLEEFLNKNDYYRNFHRYTIDNKIAINVFEYKNINKEIERFINKLGIRNQIPIPQAKAHQRRRKHYSKYYNTFTREIVEKNCFQELQQFKYEFEKSTD